jgi:O-antigen ligase
LTLFAVILSASRGGFLGLTVAALLVLLRSDRPLYKLGLAAVVLIPLLVLAPSSPLQRIMSPSHSDQESIENREMIWMAGIRMVKAHPFVGIGAGNFKSLVSIDPDWEAERSWVAHNTYLEVAAELGVPSLLLLLGVIGGTYLTAQRVARGPAPPVIQLVGEALQPALVGFCVASVFISAEYTKFFWLMVFLSTCLPSLADAADEDNDGFPWPEFPWADAAYTKRRAVSEP